MTQPDQVSIRKKTELQHIPNVRTTLALFQGDFKPQNNLLCGMRIYCKPPASMRYIWRENYFVIVPRNVLILNTFLQRYELSAQKRTKQNLGIRSHMHIRLKGVLNRPGNNHISNEGLFPLIPTKDLTATP